MHNRTVPITPIRCNWPSGVQCSRLQPPLKLAWAVKSQGLTLDKAVFDIGKEFSSGLFFVACSRVRKLTDTLFTQLFTLQRLTILAKSCRLRERTKEDQ